MTPPTFYVLFHLINEKHALWVVVTVFDLALFSKYQHPLLMKYIPYTSPLRGIFSCTQLFKFIPDEFVDRIAVSLLKLQWTLSKLFDLSFLALGEPNKAP